MNAVSPVAAAKRSVAVAKRDIYSLIQRLAREGLALIVVSSELMELIGLSHRVAVMRAGRIVATLDADPLTEEQLIAHATGTHQEPHGTLGTLVWRQEQPSQLVHLPHDGPKRILTRGSPWLHPSAQRASRIPAGHPEGFIEAFANVYGGVMADIRAHQEGAPADPIAADSPRVEDGARGVRFIERTVASAASAAKWTAWAG